ncbi:MAG: endo-1,4-beta-xylanase [Eubacteriales bacterium]
MFESSSILELFEEQKDFVNEKVTDGIERYRKGNANVRVVGKDGKAIPNAKIKITQKSHEFRFGANLFMLDELETTEKNETYKKRFADVFNMATLPFYWNTLEPEMGKPRYDKKSPKIYRRPAPELCIEFCEKNGIEPREHALAYDHFFPDWLSDAGVEEVKYYLEKHFAEISKRYADKIPTIEVTNEMEWQKGKTKFYDAHDYVEWCFKTAEKYFANNRLCINDWTGLCWEDSCRVTDKYYAYIEANTLKGAGIDAIGLQYHLFFRREEMYDRTRRLLNPTSLYRHMDLYASLGKPLQITEITIPSYSWNSEDEELQADLLEQLYSIWFSHPSVEQIICWNLADGYAHVENADPKKIQESQGNMTLGENYYHGGLLRFDMSCKPAYERLKELTQKRWHTELDTVTDKNGNADFRGFYGTYEIEVNGEIRTFRLSSKFENAELIVI